MALSECNVIIDEAGRELLEHGTLAFPIACYHDDLAAMPVPWHWHEELEAAIVTEGSAIVTSDSHKYVITAGNGFFINKSVLHAAWNADTSSCRFHSLVFHPRLVGGSMESVFWQNYINPIQDDPALQSILLEQQISWQKSALDAIETAWQNCLKEPPGYEFLVRDALSRFIYLLASHKESAETVPSSQDVRYSIRIKQMLQYIQEHCSEDLTIRQIALV